MSSDLSLVRRIQTCDDRIRALTEEIDRLPKYIAEIETKLASHKQQLSHTEALLEQNQKDRRRFEGEIGDLKTKASKLQDQMNGAKTNEQFRAFQHEIQFCKDQVTAGEDRILDKMEQAEALEDNVAKAKAELEVESTKVASEVAKARARVTDDEKQRDEQRAERQELVGKVAASTMRLYDRVSKGRGTAVAAIAEQQCRACHMIQRPQFLQDMRNLSEGVMTCESCGRIVYFQDDDQDGVGVEDPAGEHNAAG